MRARGAGIIEGRRRAASGIDAFVDIIPNNIVTAWADNDILAVMFFALFFGIGLLIANTRIRRCRTHRGRVRRDYAAHPDRHRLAPIAVACFMFNLAALFGWDLLIRLGGLCRRGAARARDPHVRRFSLPALLGGKSPIAFFRETQEARVMAFSTASSNATLPTALRVAERS